MSGRPFSVRAASLVLLVALTGASAAACSTSEAPDPETGTPAPVQGAPVLDDSLTADLQATVEQVVADEGAPGAVVLVTTPEDDWELAVGSGDLEADVALETGMAWPLRSITKSFTVALVLQLVDQGELSLDDTIDGWVEGVPNGDQVTLAQLADMTSGLGDYTSESFVDDFIADPERQFTLDELIAYGIAEPARAEPGIDRVYTNLNTLLLGRVVEEVTGVPFQAALAERILEPLGLANTVYPVTPDDAVRDVVGYAPDEIGGLTPEPVNFSVFGPAGAMIATTRDLAIWGAALAEGTLLDDQTQALRLEGAPLDEGPEYDEYAQGIGQLNGWWGHTGEGFGFTSLVMHDADTGTSVVVVVNASQLDTHVPTTLFRAIEPLLSDS